MITWMKERKTTMALSCIALALLMLAGTFAIIFTARNNRLPDVDARLISEVQTFDK